MARQRPASLKPSRQDCPAPEHPEKSGFLFSWKQRGNFYHFQETKLVRGISINPSKSGGQDPRNHQAVEIQFSLLDENGYRDNHQIRAIKKISPRTEEHPSSPFASGVSGVTSSSLLSLVLPNLTLLPGERRATPSAQLSRQAPQAPTVAARASLIAS